jgi:hypothetical protein
MALQTSAEKAVAGRHITVVSVAMKRASRTTLAADFEV